MASGAAIETPSITVQTATAMPLLRYQRRAVESRVRFRWSCWSRQTGKSFALSLRRIVRGLNRGRNQIFLSASEQQSRELMAKARQHLQAMKIAADFRADRTFEGTSFRQLEITLPNGVRIIGLPANPQTARGFTGDVLLDEFSMHRDARAIWGSMFPTLLRGDGELDICSTPKGRKNMFYRLGSNERFERDTVTIHDAVAAGLPADVDELRQAMADEELWRQEFECEFVDESTAFLTYEDIAACEDQRLETALDIEALAEAKGDVYVGVDIGRRHDLTVVWPFEKIGNRLISRGLIEMRNVRFREQYARLSDVLGHRGIRRTCIDASGLGMQMAESAVEDFGASRVEAVTFTQAVKETLAGDLRIRVQDRSIAIPVSDRIRNDWHAIQKIVTTAGNVRYQAERDGGNATGIEGGHADRFWAAALAIHAAGTATGPAEALMGRPLTFSRGAAW